MWHIFSINVRAHSRSYNQFFQNWNSLIESELMAFFRFSSNNTRYKLYRISKKLYCVTLNHAACNSNMKHIICHILHGSKNKTHLVNENWIQDRSLFVISTVLIYSVLFEVRFQIFFILSKNEKSRRIQLPIKNKVIVGKVKSSQNKNSNAN